MVTAPGVFDNASRVALRRAERVTTFPLACSPGLSLVLEPVVERHARISSESRVMAASKDWVVLS